VLATLREFIATIISEKAAKASSGSKSLKGLKGAKAAGKTSGAPLDDPLSPRVILVGHDWGGIIAQDLASGDNPICDALVVVNVCNAASLRAACARRIYASARILRQAATLFRFDLLKAALANSRPVLSQFIRSGYIFVFRLPKMVVRPLLKAGDSWVLWASTRASHRKKAEVLASLGPSRLSIESSGTYKGCERKFGDEPATMARYYSEYIGSEVAGVFLSEQTDSNQTGQRGAILKAPSATELIHTPTVVIWGVEDPHLRKDLSLDGLSEFIPDLQVVELPRAGHWAQLTPIGEAVLEVVVVGLVENSGYHVKKDVLDIDQDCVVRLYGRHTEHPSIARHGSLSLGLE
jgi:pimeloyl-ACP methyl ester carboxylesterase